jgi:uroporphyrinogen-III synthase
VAVLVTRPHPDNEATAAALRTDGFEVLLAPMLRFEPLAFLHDPSARYAGVIVTSANALRAIAPHPLKDSLTDLPLFAVGHHTAGVARTLGFHDIAVGNSNAMALSELIDAHLRDQKTGAAAPVSQTLLYLAGAEHARDLSQDLGARGFTVVTHATYRMAPVARLPAEVCDGFAANDVEAILHYSRRSALAFIAAARTDGVEISALALPQCCISDAVAAVMYDAGAARVVVARSPDEAAMRASLGHLLHRPR